MIAAAAIANEVPTLQSSSPGTWRFPAARHLRLWLAPFDICRERDQAAFALSRAAPRLRSLYSHADIAERVWNVVPDSGRLARFLVKEMRGSRTMPWRQLNGGRVTLFPRWLSDTSLIYGGDNARNARGVSSHTTARDTTG
jgi:hypothetical protein